MLIFFICCIQPLVDIQQKIRNSVSDLCSRTCYLPHFIRTFIFLFSFSPNSIALVPKTSLSSITRPQICDKQLLSYCTCEYYKSTSKANSFFFNLLLKDNCFTEFCCFLSNLNMNQPQVYIYPLPFEPPSHLPPHITPLD